MTNLDSILKRRDITLPTKGCLVKAMVFPVVMYGCESWITKKADCRRIDALNCDVGEDSGESLGLQGLIIHWKDWCWSLNSNTLATRCEELTPWTRPWCWERLKAGGEGDDRGWDGWVASPTQWTWVSASSGSWWRTGKLGVLQSMESQRVGHDWATELNWTDEIKHPKLFISGLSFDFFCLTHSLSRPYAPVSLHCIWALMLLHYFKLLLPL